MNEPGSEGRVLSDPLIQAELARQDRDIHELLSAGRDEDVLARLRSRAQVEAEALLGH